MNHLIFQPEFPVFPSKWYLPLFTPDVPGFNCTVLTRLYLLLGSPECGLSTKHVLEITNWFSCLSASQRIEGIPHPHSFSFHSCHCKFRIQRNSCNFDNGRRTGIVRSLPDTVLGVKTYSVSNILATSCSGNFKLVFP